MHFLSFLFGSFFFFLFFAVVVMSSCLFVCFLVLSCFIRFVDAYLYSNERGNIRVKIWVFGEEGRIREYLGEEKL